VNRKGIWQWLWISLFFLILVIALALLFTERKSLEPQRAELEQDLANQRAEAALVDALRMPVRLDANGDGVEEEGTLALLIARNEEKDDVRIREALDEGLKTASYAIAIEHQDGREIRFTGGESGTTPLERGDAIALLPAQGGVVRVSLGIWVYPTSAQKLTRQREDLYRRVR
jgi:hypothetical protein